MISSAVPVPVSSRSTLFDRQPGNASAGGATVNARFPLAAGAPRFCRTNPIPQPANPTLFDRSGCSSRPNSKPVRPRRNRTKRTQFRNPPELHFRSTLPQPENANVRFQVPAPLFLPNEPNSTTRQSDTFRQVRLLKPAQTKRTQSALNRSRMPLQNLRQVR